MSRNIFFAGIKYDYQPLLERYARRCIKDADAASSLVNKFLQEQNWQNGGLPWPGQRLYLKRALLNRCYYYRYSQVFNRPLIWLRSPGRKGEGAGANKIVHPTHFSCD